MVNLVTLNYMNRHSIDSKALTISRLITRNDDRKKKEKQN